MTIPGTIKSLTKTQRKLKAWRGTSQAERFGQVPDTERFEKSWKWSSVDIEMMISYDFYILNYIFNNYITVTVIYIYYKIDI